MMDFEMFIEKVVEEVSKELSTLEVKKSEVTKNNGMKLRSITITSDESNVSPVIYLEGFFSDYQEGRPMKDITEGIIKLYRESATNTSWDVSAFTNYSSARTLLRPRLINTEKNKELLANVPHREILDLSLIYSVELSGDFDGVGTIIVRNEHMKLWDVDEQTLYEEVLKNMEEYDEGSLRTMKDVLLEMIGCDMEMLDSEISIPMYVLTNRSKLYGASQLINKSMLAMAAKTIGSDLIILPSSVHELLILPVADNMTEMDHMTSMVREVNDSEVAMNEILSYHVYRYDSVTGEVSIAA